VGAIAHHEELRLGVWQLAFMDERVRKRIETVVAWVGYFIAFMGLIGLLLSLVLEP
jgi:hypothetical protein